jgi:hypothetical protein
VKIQSLPQVHRRPLKPGQQLGGLDELRQQGLIDSYQRSPEGVVVVARNPEAADRLAALPVEGGVLTTGMTGSLAGKVKNFVLPTEFEGRCAPEYLRHRGWSMAAAAISGVLGFLMTTVHLDSIKASFSTSEKAAMASVITGSIGKATQMMGWSLAKKGDADPKSSYLLASTISGLNTVAGLSILSILPHTNLALTAATSLTGTLGGVIGSASGVNIFNHLASGPNKGEVATKNGNQDLLVSCLGMPGGLLMSWAARSLGMKPALFGALTLGPALLYCSAKAATSLRMNAVDGAELKTLVQDYLQKGHLPEAPPSGLWSSFNDIWSKAPGFATSQQLTDFPETALFGSERYLLTEKEGQPLLAFSKEANAADLVRGYAHALLLQQSTGQQLSQRLKDSYQQLPEQLPGVDDFRQAGWNLNFAQLGVQPIEARW